MSQPEANSVRLKVSPQVARIVGPGAPRELQQSAARGALPLAAADQLTMLCFLCAGTDPELRSEAVRTLRALPAELLLPVIADPALHPRLLDLLARVRIADLALMEPVIAHPATDHATLRYLAERAELPVLARLVELRPEQAGELGAALMTNPHASPEIKERAGLQVPVAEPLLAESSSDEEAAADEEDETEVFPEAVDGNPDEVEEVSDEQIAGLLAAAEEKGLSKYQLAMELKVSEKIKIAMSGDKEWRKILIKDPNKLVHGAVLKNGRVTEGEILMVAKNKTSSDELIRQILLNRDWIKGYEIRSALVTHPKTPLPKAIRFIADLSLRDLKNLMRSRNVATAIATTARREVERRMKRGG